MARPGRQRPIVATARRDESPGASTHVRCVISDAIAVLEKHRDRTSAELIRAALWRWARCAERDTLSDVLARPDARVVSDVLIALERATFTRDGDVPDAVDAACSALRRSARSMR